MKNEPAFPCEWSKVHHTPGMTLRDYFAAKAMQGYLTQNDLQNFTDIARNAYSMADAMINARGSK